MCVSDCQLMVICHSLSHSSSFARMSYEEEDTCFSEIDSLCMLTFEKCCLI
jgi:hypothetical protein